MTRNRLLKASVRTSIVAAALAVGTLPLAAGASVTSTHSRALQWAAQGRAGNVVLSGTVPLAVSGKNAKGTPAARLIGKVSSGAELSLNVSLPLRNMKGLEHLIVAEAKTHTKWSRTALYAHFAPPTAQYNALRRWAKAEGFTVTHLGRDRLLLTVRAKAAAIERALHVTINVYRGSSYVNSGVLVPAQDFYANINAPTVPARLGIQTITGLTNVDSADFFTDLQLTAAKLHGPAAGEEAAHSLAPLMSASGHAVTPHTRSTGYYPRDLRAMYDVTSTTNYAHGQTTGYTLWGPPEQQGAATAYGSNTGDTANGITALTVDANCSATGNSPTTPSSCSTTQEAPNHLLSILENGNTTADNYGANAETGLDVEVSHGVAPGDAEKYYLGDCSLTPSPGLTNGDNCNGSDVGLEDAVEDAANDPTLHSVSNSFGYGGEPEFGATDPLNVAFNNSFAIAAAAGTTFWFSTGDSGTYESGYPADNPNVVSVGGTSVFSTTALTGSATGVLSTADTWAGAGSWCSNIFARPAWQTGAGVAANASCPGRATPDISADADTNTAVYECYTTSSAGADSCGSVGGTSVAGPIMNGLEADTENYVAAQSYPGSTPAVGFEGPVMYQMGNSANSSDYYRDVYCGNNADPTGGPDGSAAQPGWDEATGWGEIDWQHYSTGYAQQLGATGLSTPSSLIQNYQWDCAATPGNPTEHGIAYPSSSVGYAVGTATTTPWFATYLSSGAWGATNTFVKTTNGGSTWVPVNADMMDITCTSSTTCLEVGDGGVIQMTTNSGSTWTSVNNTAFKQALTQIQCPTSTICFAAGDRGEVLQSSNGGGSWSYSPSVDGNPIYGLSCPDASTCYAVDNYAHVMVTTNGGASWSMQTTPVTTPAINVPGSGGPNPYAGLFGISCSSDTTCVAVGGYPPSGETYPPVVYTTNGGTTWTLANPNVAAATDYVQGVSCVPGTTTCFAVGRGGVITQTTNLSAWTAMTSNTTKMLNSIDCLSATYCVATGQSGTIDVYNGSSWTVSTTTLGSSAFLAGVVCLTASSCYAAGHQGVTVNFDSTNVLPTISQLNGGGYTGTLDALSCASNTNCIAVGASGTIVATTNGGQTWLPQTDPYGTSPTLDGVSCSGSDCAIVGTSGDTLYTTNFGTTWTEGTSGITQTIEGVSCTATFCAAPTAVAPTDSDILVSPLGAGTWTAHSSGLTAALDGINCLGTECIAGGAALSGHPILVGTSNSGTSWSTQTAPSTATEALSSVACADANDCYAGGANGEVIVTNNGGSSWFQEGNPMSGPLSALNTGTTSSILAIDGAACSSTACAFATASSGDIMVTQLVTATVNATGTYGTTTISGLSPSSSAIAYSPSAEASSVTGSLSCSTSATPTSPVGSYAVSNCSGLAAPGYNVIYNYAGSSYTTTPGPPTASISSPSTGGTYAVSQSVPTSFSCADIAGGPGITSCVDSNGASSGTGALSTSTPGTFTYTVTATSADSQTGTASISYTVAAAPTASITSPSTGGTYTIGTSVATTFSCAEGSSGPGLASCVDSNGSTGGSGSLDTSSVGPQTYTVTATSIDGQSDVATIDYTVVAVAPTATITSPAGGGLYAVGASVPTSFSCSEGTGGTGITSCVDSNGTSSPSGALDTTTPGSFTYSVTATSGDGQTDTTSISYTVASAPTASITSPTTGNTYAVGQSVPTSFSCADSTYGPGITSCVDSNGSTDGTGSLDTSTPGDFTYSVTATSSDGQTDTATISFAVATPPTATITSPPGGGYYAVGASVPTSFGCADSTFGPGIATCVDSNGASGTTGSLVTTTAGNFEYSVTATSSDGQADTSSIFYTVAAAPTATITSPPGGGTYAIGQSVPSSFSCADSTFGPGIASCKDSNGSTSGSGSLTTSSAGDFTYSVTATSNDGQTHTTSISYTVAAAPSATISSPTGDTTYAVGQSVPSSFSCADSTYGPGISSCKDSNGASSGTGSLTTSVAGDFTYSVTAKSSDGQSTTTSISYTVAAAPTATIHSPATGGSYTVGQSVTTSFSCADSTFGPGIATCKDSNGSSTGAGSLSTSTVGPHTYTVTATSSDGQTGTASISYSVGQIAQVIHFTSTAPASATYHGATYTVAASGGGSGNPVTFASGTASVCAVSGTTVSFVGIGSCTIDANQAGNATYSAAAQATQTFSVGKAKAVITITSTPPASAVVNGTYKPTATSSSGDAVKISLGTGSSGCLYDLGYVAFTSAGTCIVVFNDAGSADYSAATQLQQSMVVSKATLTMTASASPSSATSASLIKLSGKLSTGLATGTVTFKKGSTVLCSGTVSSGSASCHPTVSLAKGTYTVTATYSGSSSYNTASATVSIRIT